MVASFVRRSGLKVVETALSAALKRGAQVRLLTSDYLNVTQPGALTLILDWVGATAAQGATDEQPAGSLEARVVETAVLARCGVRAFHPKSWRLEGPDFAVAFVGSSNLSESALSNGVEWNLRVDREADPHPYRLVAEAFERTWRSAEPLTAAWISAYARRVAEAPPARPPGAVDPEAKLCPQPHLLQQEALEQLAHCRQQGRDRALVVLATGLGKTLLAAFDIKALGSERGIQPRVLFLAHKWELLDQAQRAIRRVIKYPAWTITWFMGKSKDLSGSMVLASVQTLSKPEALERLRRARFDYVIVDEVHHAAALSYRRVLSCLQPTFLLGLTATPDRADQGDILGLFGDVMTYRADLGAGIQSKRLVPFDYHGIKDDVDFPHITRGPALDPQEPTAAS